MTTTYSDYTVTPSAFRTVNRLCYLLAYLLTYLLVVVVWRSGSGRVGRIDELTLRRARLVLGWVTVFGRANHLGM